MESARPAPTPEPALAEDLSRLNEFAVLAFCAEMTRLPGHCAPRSVPEKAMAHTTPSLFTTVAHIWRSRPLDSAATALSSATLRAPYRKILAIVVVTCEGRQRHENNGDQQAKLHRELHSDLQVS